MILLATEKEVARVAVSITPLSLEALSGAKLTANDDLGWRRELAAQANPCELVTPKNSPCLLAHIKGTPGLTTLRKAASERLLDQGVGIGVGAGSLEKISRDAGIDAIRLNHDGIPMKSGAPASLAGAPSGGLEYSQVCGEADQAASACRLDAKAEKERFGKTRG